MADFNVDIPAAQTYQQPQQPVQDNSTAQAVGGLGSIFAGVGDTIANASKMGLQLQLQKAQTQVLGQFNQNLLRHGDLVDQGAENFDAARRSARQLLASNLAQHPSMTPQLIEAYNTALASKGMAANLTTGTQQDQDEHALTQQHLQDAQKAGFGLPSMPPDQQQHYADLYTNFQLAQAQLDAQSKVVNFKKSQVELTNANLATTAARQSIVTGAINQQKDRIQLQDAVDQHQQNGAVLNMMGSYTPVFDQKSTAIADSANAGKVTPVLAQLFPNLKPGDPLSKQQALQMNQDLVSGTQAQFASAGAATNRAGYFDNLANVFKLKADYNASVIKGDVDKSVLDNTNHNIGAVHDNVLLGDPQTAQMASILRIFPNIAGAVPQALTQGAVRMLKQNHTFTEDGTLDTPTSPANGSTINSQGKQVPVPGPTAPNPFSSDPDTSADIRQVLTGVTGAIKLNNSGRASPQQAAETKGQMVGLLTGMGKYGNSIDNPTEAKDLIQFLGNADVGSYLSKNPDILNGAAGEKAVDVWQDNYRNQVLPLIQDEFTKANVYVGQKESTAGGGRYGVITQPDMRPAQGQIQVVFNDMGMKFVANDQNAGDGIRNSKSPAGTAARLNKEVAPIVNQMVRVEAHLNGNQDYKDAALKMSSLLFEGHLNKVDTKPTQTEAEVRGN